MPKPIFGGGHHTQKRQTISNVKLKLGHREVELNPGHAGIQFSLDGVVKYVRPGQQADKHGVQVGDRAVTIAGKPFSAGLYNFKRGGSRPYTIVFKTKTVPSTLRSILAWADIACWRMMRAKLVFLRVTSQATIQLMMPELLALLGLVVRAAGAAIACTAAPFRISAALETAESKLTQLRSHSPELHGQVTAVEAVMAQANRGRGIGVSVGGHLVVNRGLIQRAILSLAGVAAVLWSLGDWVLGVEDKEYQALMNKMDVLNDHVHGLDRQVQTLSKMMRSVPGLVKDMQRGQ
ncbi:unnamed protein product [Prorocentrum cordatum]|uniref:PDZ domain-containing protein n=1 Tax=Prorocentrum cordatum TaxID=2364126 RepID=A0ABN9VQ30_9DINO|nr:unnamed protein product [Polarella glacialis]